MTSNYCVDMAAYPHAYGLPAARGVLRADNADFQVEEVLGFTLEGDGPHLWLWIEKSGVNTDWAAGRIARCASVKKRDVGFSGMKDRHAITRQWFSLPAPAGEVDWRSLEASGIRVLEAVRHRRKLKRGAHRANRFIITVRDAMDLDDIDSRIDAVREHGVPNYFGAQRFGRNGDNVVRALDGARGGIYLSAMRSFLFNAVLAGRVAGGTWNRLLPGEAVQLDGSRSFFAVDDDPAIESRLQAFDIHPSGPMWGSGELPTRHEVHDLELAVARRYPELCEQLESAGLRQERRSLRLKVGNLEFARDGNQLRFGFELETGAFATTVLRELVTTEEQPAGEQHA